MIFRIRLNKNSSKKIFEPLKRSIIASENTSTRGLPSICSSPEMRLKQANSFSKSRKFDFKRLMPKKPNQEFINRKKIFESLDAATYNDSYMNHPNK